MDKRTLQTSLVEPLQDPRVVKDTGAGVLRLAPGLSEAELVARVIAGDRWAEEAFYRRHVELVAGTALRLLRHRAETEDVVQETFILAFQRLGQLRDPQAVRGWLVQIALSRVHRRLRWNPLRKLVGLGRKNDAEDLAACAMDDLGADERAELALVERALAGVKQEERTAWLLRHAVGCSLEEVATACGCSLAAVKRRLDKADTYLARTVRKGERDG
ncbi:MAG: RNA polymerase sigma factor [Myxococcales bacterium]